MANLTLELNMYSAKDLENVNFIVKMDVYAVVSIRNEDDSKNSQKEKTPIDRSGGSHPTWNHAIKFSVDDRLVRDGRLTLVVKLVCDRVLGDKEIGQVTVPVLELLCSNPSSPSTNGDGNGNGMKFVTYQVRTPSGRGKGSLTFSYRFDSGLVQSNFQVEPDIPVYPRPNPVSDYPSVPTPSPIRYPPSSQPQPHPVQSGSLYPDLGKLGEPVTVYPPQPAGPIPGPLSHQLYPYLYPPPSPAEKPGHTPLPQSCYGYAPPPDHYGYGYPLAHPGYGYGYGYSQPPAMEPPKKNKAGLGFGAGLLRA